MGLKLSSIQKFTASAKSHQMYHVQFLPKHIDLLFFSSLDYICASAALQNQPSSFHFHFFEAVSSYFTFMDTL